MISVGAIFATVMKVVFNLVGVAILIGISVVVGKVAFDIIKDIFIYAWKTVHKGSYDSFIEKREAKKRKREEVKNDSNRDDSGDNGSNGSGRRNATKNSN